MRETNDEIPNLGFSLSNKKLLRTGFKFLYNIERNLKEMIDKWSEQDIPKELEHVRDGENLFIDKRGKISNHELTEPINLIGLIDSKKGTIRANHCIPSKSKNVVYKRTNYRSVQDIINPTLPK